MDAKKAKKEFAILKLENDHLQEEYENGLEVVSKLQRKANNIAREIEAEQKFQTKLINSKLRTWSFFPGRGRNPEFGFVYRIFYIS